MIMQNRLPNSNAGAEQKPVIRCAIYARYSSESQRDTSTEDQIRNCRAGAERNGWIVLDEFIRFDEAMTGRTVAGRDGLADLIRLAKQRPKPFDCILIDDTDWVAIFQTFCGNATCSCITAFSSIL